MQMDRFRVGDRFFTMHDAQRVKILEIRYVFDFEKDRWETEVVYEECTIGYDDPQVIAKAADFVRMIRDGGFDQQISRSGAEKILQKE